MKHCDDCGIGDVRSRLSPVARPFTFPSFSSWSVHHRSSRIFSLAASESEPHDCIRGDYAGDLSFLTSDEQRSGGLDDADAATNLLKAEGSELYGQAAYESVKDQRIILHNMRQDNFKSFLGLSSFLESDLRSADSQPQVSPSVPVNSTNQSNSIVNLEDRFATNFSSTSVLGYTGERPAVNGVPVASVNSSDAGAEGHLPYAKAASFGKGLVNESIGENNPNSLFSTKPDLRIRCSIGVDNDKLDLHSANSTGMFEKSSTPSEQDDSEVDSPCWRGTQSYNTVASGSKAMSSRHSTDDLNRFYRLNPLAPQFIPASAKKSLENHAKECEESSSSSLKKSLSSTFPLSSGDYSLIDIPNKAIVQQSSSKTDRTTGGSFLTQGADKSFGFVSQDSVSNTLSLLDSRNELRTSKKLDPSAPVFVPASAKLNVDMHEKQAGVDHKVEFTNSAGVVSSFGNQFYNGVHEPGTSDSFKPWLGSGGGISENASTKIANEKVHGRHRLNPLAHKFSLADTKQNVDGCKKNHTTDDPLPVVHTAVSSASSVYRDCNVVGTALVRSKPSYLEPYSTGIGMTQMECVRPSKLLGSSSLVSSVADHSMKVEDNFTPVEHLDVEPKALSVKGNKDIEHLLSFNISEDSASPASSNMKALSDLSQRYGCPSSPSSPEMVVKKILTTMHGLSELLTLVQGHSCVSDSSNEQEVTLINCIVQNFKLYMRKRVEGHAGNSSSVQQDSYDSKQFTNKHKLSIRDLQPPGANNMTVNLDVKRKEKHSAVSSDRVPHSHLSESSLIRGNGFAQVVGSSAFQQNRSTEEQINPQVLFYRSLWLKAEAERCLIEYEASLSRMKL